MLYRPFDPAVIYAAFSHSKYASFADWETAAQAATQTLIDWTAAHPVKQKGESLPVDSEFYGMLKESLKLYFEGKCAYCESNFDDVAFGDVEHYRPKRAVFEELAHQGYHWLAYCASNLMPSCEMCNRGKGKRNQFPIQGTRARVQVDDLDQEQPLLLNPYQANDCGPNAQHLDYEIQRVGWQVVPTGLVLGLSDRGNRSIEVYGLNREPLVRSRRKSQTAAVEKLDLAVVRMDTLRQKWQEIFSSQQEHAAAVRAVCRRWMQAYLAEINMATADL